jgi:uncharacterized Zn finger protein
MDNEKINLLNKLIQSTNATIRSRGNRIFEKIKDLQIDYLNNNNEFSVTIESSTLNDFYTVDLTYSDVTRKIKANCDCSYSSYSYEYSGNCKHIIAAAQLWLYLMVYNKIEEQIKIIDKKNIPIILIFISPILMQPTLINT